MPLEINVKDAVREFDAVIAFETVPYGNQAGVLFGGVRSFEEFIDGRAYRIDRGQDVPGGRLLEGPASVLEELLIGEYDVDLDREWRGRQ